MYTDVSSKGGHSYMAYGSEKLKLNIYHYEDGN